MSTLRRVEKHLGKVSTELTLMLRDIDMAQGRQEAFKAQHPQQREALVRSARIESTEASNSIEGVVAPHARIVDLVERDAQPQNRSEEEIAGYRRVLDIIHTTEPAAIPFSVNVVKQFHADLYAFRPGGGGNFKMTDNEVIEHLPDGSQRVRFPPVPAWQTNAAMVELHSEYRAATEAERYHPLVVVASYVHDFLVIHPFTDGNGRMSRLLTLVLLGQHGYDVGRFVSLEGLIEETKETYYQALQASTTGWHEDTQDPAPWIRYFLGVMIASYRRFESRVGALGGRGSKTEAVKRFISSSVSDEFSIADIRRATPGVSDDLIRKVLGELRAEGVISAGTRGPSATYRRIRR